MNNTFNNMRRLLLPTAILLVAANVMAGQSLADSSSASATGGTAAVSMAGGGQSAGGGIIGGNSTVWSTGSNAGGSAGTDGEVWGTANTRKNKAWVTVGGSGNTWANAYSNPDVPATVVGEVVPFRLQSINSNDDSCGNMHSVGANTKANRRTYKYCSVAVDRNSNSLYAGCCTARYYVSKKKR